jgi:hypothetical protein
MPTITYRSRPRTVSSVSELSLWSHASHSHVTCHSIVGEGTNHAFTSLIAFALVRYGELCMHVERSRSRSRPSLCKLRGRVWPSSNTMFCETGQDEQCLMVYSSEVHYRTPRKFTVWDACREKAYEAVKARLGGWSAMLPTDLRRCSCEAVNCPLTRRRQACLLTFARL